MTAPGPRRYSRSILRGYVAELRRQGILEEAERRASESLLPLLRDPRRAPAWLPAAPLDELVALAGALRGREAVREMGYQMMSAGGLATVLGPIVQLSLETLGPTPGALFSRAELMAQVISEGLELTWRPSGSTSGTVRIRSGEAVPELSWVPWEGAFTWVFEATRTSGAVSAARPAANGRTCEIEVSWTPR